MNTVDYWTEGYDPPCRANNFQSNQPSAYQIDLHYSSEPQLEWHYQTTILMLAEATSAMRKRELSHQFETILEEYRYRGLEPKPFKPKSNFTK